MCQLGRIALNGSSAATPEAVGAGNESIFGSATASITLVLVELVVNSQILSNSFGFICCVV